MLELCVRGYHLYKDIWEAAIGEELQCERETRNTKDRYAVAVKKDGMVVGHLPRKISHLCSIFLRRGNIVCCVSGRRRYSADLPQFHVYCIAPVLNIKFRVLILLRAKYSQFRFNCEYRKNFYTANLTTATVYSSRYIAYTKAWKQYSLFLCLHSID